MTDEEYRKAYNSAIAEINRLNPKKPAATPRASGASAPASAGGRYQPLSEYDYKALGTNGRIARAFAIKNGTAYEFRGWGPGVRQRTAVKAPAPVVKVKSKHPISPADYELLHPKDRLARANAAKEDSTWTPKGYGDAAFVKRVQVNAVTSPARLPASTGGAVGQVLVPTG